MNSNTVTFDKKWIDRAIPLRFKINFWLLKQLGLFGFGFFAFLTGAGTTVIIYEFLL